MGVRSWCCNVHFNVRQLQLSLRPLTMTMTMITHTVNSCNKALTCPWGQGAWAVALSLIGEEKTRSMQDTLNKVFRPDLLPLGIKWSCICAGKELRSAQDECVVRNPGCCFFDGCPCCRCLGFALAVREELSRIESSIVSDSQSFNTLIGMDEGTSFISNATSPFDSLKWKTAGGSH